MSVFETLAVMDQPTLTDTDLYRVMNFDALGEVTDMLGGGSTDESVFAAIPLMQSRGAVLKREFQARHDTHFAATVAEYELALTEEGFEKVFELPFTSSERGYDDTFYMWARRDGVLACFDTYMGKRPEGTVVNSGNVYLVRNVQDDPYPISMSRSTKDGVQLCHFDIREGMRLKLALLSQAEPFVAKWPHQPFLWLLHYDDAKQEGYDYRAINRERLAALPQWVQDFVGPYED